MLVKNRCPHTGVVNFFHRTEPLLPIGSIVESRHWGFIWRAYVEDSQCGAARDLLAAEMQLRQAVARDRHLSPTS
jgi:hypothetical protein